MHQSERCSRLCRVGNARGSRRPLSKWINQPDRCSRFAYSREHPVLRTLCSCPQRRKPWCIDKCGWRFWQEGPKLKQRIEAVSESADWVIQWESDGSEQQPEAFVPGCIAREERHWRRIFPECESERHGLFRSGKLKPADLEIIEVISPVTLASRFVRN